MARETEQLSFREAVAPQGTFRLLSEIPITNAGKGLGNALTKRAVEIHDSDKPNRITVQVRVKDGSGMYPQTRYSFTIDSSDEVRDVSGCRQAGMREKTVDISASFDDILSEVISTHRHQKTLKGTSPSREGFNVADGRIRVTGLLGLPLL